MEALLETKELTKSFGGLVAVNEVNFTVREGELKSIIGPNGAGKTTLVNLITGVLKQDKGKIYFANEDITDLPPHIRVMKGITRTYQLSNLFLNLTVFENVRLAAHMGRSRKIFTLKPAESFEEVIKIAEETLKLLGLYEKRNFIVKELSHGDRRLVEVAIALALNPKVLLLDEPTAGLSIKETTEFIDVIGKLKKLSLIHI